VEIQGLIKVTFAQKYSKNVVGTQKYFIPRFHVDMPSVGQTTGASYVIFGMKKGHVRHYYL
jgi:hypothetical protein